MSIRAIAKLPNMQNFGPRMPLMNGRSIEAMTLRSL
jgi:hypothetical protein